MDEILEAVRKDIFEKMYPVGSLYVTLSDSSTCPIKQYIPNSTWKLVANNQCLQGTSNTSNAGKEIEAAIPNIKGNASPMVEEGNADTLSGPFYSDNVLRSKGHGGGRDYYLLFDASRCSSVYKNNCKTVQPPALTVCVWKRTA